MPKIFMELVLQAYLSRKWSQILHKWHCQEQQQYTFKLELEGIEAKQPMLFLGNKKW